LLQAADWRVLFLINVPLGAAAALAAFRRRALLPPDRPDATARLDAKGLALLAAGLGLLIYVAGQAATSGWTAASIWPLWATGLILLATYRLYARRRPAPAVRLDLLTRTSTAIPVILTGLAGVVLFGMLFLIPVFLQDQAGDSALTTGLVLLPQGLAMGASTWLGQRTATRLGLRTTVALGLVVLTVSTAAFAAVTASSPAWIIAALLTGRGMAIGLILTPLLDVLLLPLPAESMDDATTMFNIAQRLGGSVGIAALGSIYAAAGFHDTIWALAGLAAAGLVMVPSLTTAKPRKAAA
jgi:predicted MFS family arabinose efflux permease